MLPRVAKRQVGSAARTDDPSESEKRACGKVVSTASDNGLHWNLNCISGGIETFLEFMDTVDAIEVEPGRLSELQVRAMHLNVLLSNPRRVRAATTVSDLPCELWHHVVKYLAPSPEDLCNFRSTCTLFRELANEATQIVYTKPGTMIGAEHFARFPSAKRLVIRVIGEHLKSEESRKPVPAYVKLCWSLFRSTRPDAPPGSLTLELGQNVRCFKVVRPKRIRTEVEFGLLDLAGQCLDVSASYFSWWYSDVQYQCVTDYRGPMGTEFRMNGSLEMRNIESTSRVSYAALYFGIASAKSFVAKINCDLSQHHLKSATMRTEFIQFNAHIMAKTKTPWTGWCGTLFHSARWHQSMPRSCEVVIHMPRHVKLRDELVSGLRKRLANQLPPNVTGHPMPYYAVHIHHPDADGFSHETIVDQPWAQVTVTTHPMHKTMEKTAHVRHADVLAYYQKICKSN